MITDPDQAPETWDDWQWDEWVPQEDREMIVVFWSGFGRKPQHWVSNCNQSYVPRTGSTIIAYTSRGLIVRGRYIHRWNNMGTVVECDGSRHCVSGAMSVQAALESFRHKTEEAERLRARLDRQLKELENLRTWLPQLAEIEALAFAGVEGEL